MSDPSDRKAAARVYRRAGRCLFDALREALPVRRVDRPCLTALDATLAEPLTGARKPERSLGLQLTTYVERHPDRRDWLTDRMRHAARSLAVHGKPPRTRARMLAWQALILAARRLHTGRLVRLRRRSFLSDRGWQALREEARRLAPVMPTRRTHYSSPGPVLQRLAVDRRLQRNVSRAIGFAVEPAHTAVYMYDPPRAHMPPHLDSSDFEIVVHVVLEHDGWTRAQSSALIVHHPHRDVRCAVAPGAAVVLAGRGAVHQWEPLGAQERRTLIGIGFRPVAAAAS
ncbi:MAG: hypothetical protein ABL982_07965 [Vicinamibacterales bacterium]